ncbi:MAG: response regulator transcription factor [Chloroflexota bacterium]|jgi:DNA-binding response OmpR family regulator
MKALIVDDDRVLADLVAFTLQREGFQVSKAYNGEMALKFWAENRPDLVVLDVNLPDTDGFALCRRMRREADTPIIMLTVRGDDDDVIQGLQLGADDYVQKPFSPRQLVARIQAVLRRAGKAMAPSTRRVGELSLDVNRRLVQIGPDRVVPLTSLEARLLDYLMLNAGHVLTSDSIMNHVWGAEGADRDMLRQLVYRLRRKIEPDPANPQYIETVAGFGYGLTLPE